MAVWQVCFNIVEKNNHNNDEDICFWNNEPDNVYDITFLKRINSWSKDIIQYGELQNTCIELLIENNRVIEVSIKLDLRNMTKDLLINIINYIASLNANIYYQNEIIIPSTENICNIIRKSNAYKYCNNPIEYLNDLE